MTELARDLPSYPGPDVDKTDSEGSRDDPEQRTLLGLDEIPEKTLWRLGVWGADGVILIYIAMHLIFGIK